MILRHSDHPTMHHRMARALRCAGMPALAVAAALAAPSALIATASAATGAVAVTITQKPANPTTSTSAVLKWSTSGAPTSTTCSLDGAAATPCSTGKSYSGLAAGAHSFTVRVASASASAVATGSWSVQAPAVAPPPPATASVWDGDMEEGALSDWYAPSVNATSNFGGGEYDSGSGVTNASGAMAHTGAYSAKMSLTDGVGGTRMFRWRELQAKRTTTQSTWMYIPRNYTFTADPNTGRYWILFEFKSRTSDNVHNDPFWYVNAYNRADGSMGAKLAWGYQSKLAGPHAGESGWRSYGDVTIPVGRWFQIDSTLTQSKDFTGAISVTLDGQPLASLTGVRTGWPNCTYNAWCVEQHWAVTNYSDGIAQTPADIYVDDAKVS
jgi:hypothetical protein